MNLTDSTVGELPPPEEEEQAMLPKILLVDATQKYCRLDQKSPHNHGGTFMGSFC